MGLSALSVYLRTKMREEAEAHITRDYMASMAWLIASRLTKSQDLPRLNDLLPSDKPKDTRTGGQILNDLKEKMKQRKRRADAHGTI